MDGLVEELFVPSVMSVAVRDRKSTRLNSSHVSTSYAVFCLKKKNDTASGAVQSNMNGFFNTAIGNFALFSNGIGNSDTASGAQALLNNKIGEEKWVMLAGAF